MHVALEGAGEGGGGRVVEIHSAQPAGVVVRGGVFVGDEAEG